VSWSAPAGRFVGSSRDGRDAVAPAADHETKAGGARDIPGLPADSGFWWAWVRIADVRSASQSSVGDVGENVGAVVPSRSTTPCRVNSASTADFGEDGNGGVTFLEKERSILLCSYHSPCLISSRPRISGYTSRQVVIPGVGREAFTWETPCNVGPTENLELYVAVTARSLLHAIVLGTRDGCIQPAMSRPRPSALENWG